MYLHFSNDTFSSRSQNLEPLIHKCNALGYPTFRCVFRFEGVTDCYQSQGYREPESMSSATSAVYPTLRPTPTLTRQSLLGSDDEEYPESTRMRDRGCPLTIPMDGGYDGDEEDDDSIYGGTANDEDEMMRRDGG
ncbi:hypothetical protein Tco_0189078 [Tanacetum coccineum]